MAGRNFLLYNAAPKVNNLWIAMTGVNGGMCEWYPLTSSGIEVKYVALVASHGV